jgi:ATPase family AAA domain-containing protein 3A/B
MRLGKLRELYKGEKDSQKTIGESTREERRKPQAQNPELRKMEREARNQLEKARSEANQAVEQYKHGLKDSSLKEFALLKQRMAEREEEKKGWLSKEQEKVHTETLQLESKLKHEVDMKVVKMSTEGATRAERENHSQRLDMLKHQASERRETMLLSIKEAATQLGSGLSDFLGSESSDRRTAFALALSTAVLGIYTAKVGTGVAGRFFEARLGKPSLVRETSRDSGVLQVLASPLRRAMGSLGLPKWVGAIPPSTGDALDGVILAPQVEERLRSVASSTANTKRNRAPFRHLLLYGPPGTGKTLFAKGLAKHSGLEYAILTGGDVAPLGRDAVTEIHKVFEWAETSSKGVLLFIDESDAFLRRRATEHMSEDLRNALNAFLYRTGGASDKFMVVYASNQPEQFDWAINDRIDEMVKKKKP